MKYLIALALYVGAAFTLSAATLSDVKILGASEDIKYLTQKLAKNYIYLYIYPNKTHLHDIMTDTLNKLEKDISSIAVSTKDEKIKEILDFFAYEKEQVRLLIGKIPTNEGVTEVLDFSEALYEGAIQITNSIPSDFAFEDKMFIRSKDIEYLLEKLAKYYMVLASDIDKKTIADRLSDTIKETEEEMDIIRQYEYPKTLNSQKNIMAKLWEANKQYCQIVGTVKIPSIILASTQGLQSIMTEIAIHHSKGK